MNDVYVSNIIFTICSCFLMIIWAAVSIIPLVLMEKSRRQAWEAFF